MKVWLAEYRTELAALQNDVNVTNAAGAELKAYLSPGSSDYATMTSNEASLQQNLESICVIITIMPVTTTLTMARSTAWCRCSDIFLLIAALPRKR